VFARRYHKARLWADRRGATAVEFALVIPVFVSLLIGTFQIAWVMHSAATVRWSLDACARGLLLNPATTQTQLRSAMNAKLAGLVNPSDVTVTLVTDSSTPTAPVLRASSDYRPRLAIPLVNIWRPHLRSTTVVPLP